MWIFTKDGFYSAVEDRNDSGRVVVRTRSKADVIRLAKRLEVRAFKSSDISDYPYRLFCSKTEWSSYVAESALEIDYPNFKGAMVKRFDNVRMDQLHEVWAVMAGLYDQPIFKEARYETRKENDFDLYSQLRRLRGQAPEERVVQHRR